MKPDVFGISVQGASHVRSGTECQDSIKRVLCDNGAVIMAVADGHGSKNCPYSKTGSRIAVNTFCKILAEYVEKYSASTESLLTFLNREGDTKVAQEIDSEWKNRVYKNHIDNKREIPLDENDEKVTSRIYAQYGTTLLGLLLTDRFLFAFQIGDGDIVFVSSDATQPVIHGEKILGVETHSLCKPDAWKKAITTVRRIDYSECLPSMFLMSSDGFSNSYKNEDEFFKTCHDYFDMLNQYGVKDVKENLCNWLTETSALGSGDDISVLIAFFDQNEEAVQSETTVFDDEPKEFGGELNE